jgi:plasmid stability protein
MTNLTVALDDGIARQARIRALTEGTSLSAKVREFLADYALGPSRQKTAARAFIAAARASRANGEGAQWAREDLYDRPYS